MHIFRKEDRKLVIGKVKIHIRNIIIKHNVLLRIVFTFLFFAIASWFPAKFFISFYAKLYVNVFIMAFEFRSGFFDR